jgi:2-keto-4-pentenoate hydratase/2-oxohepta-3-ene-1,7-dioic acid hydratase in catechol pathway
MFLDVNGQRFQDGSTRTMHFDVATGISRLSQFMFLQSGGAISSGALTGRLYGIIPQSVSGYGRADGSRDQEPRHATHHPSWERISLLFASSGKHYSRQIF